MTSGFLFFSGNGFYKYLPIASTHQSKKGLTECIYGKQILKKKLRSVKNIKKEQVLDVNSYICFMFYS